MARDFWDGWGRSERKPAPALQEFRAPEPVKYGNHIIVLRKEEHFFILPNEYDAEGAEIYRYHLAEANPGWSVEIFEQITMTDGPGV